MRKTSANQLRTHNLISEPQSLLSPEDLAHVTGGSQVQALEDYDSDSRDDTPADIH